MAQFLSLCLVLGFANALIGLAMATNKPQIMVQSISVPPSNPPVEGPSSGQKPYIAEPPIIRKLGKHPHHKHVRSFVTSSPTPSPSEAPQSEKKLHSSSTEGSIPSHQRTSIEPHNEVFGSKGKVHLIKHHLLHHHHPFDKSIAGAGVILGGLATTFLVAVFCYVRATARHKPDNTAYNS